MVTPEELINEARKYLNCPWRHQGRTIHGIDCIGVIVAPMVTLGLMDQQEDVHNYKRDPEGRRLVDMLHQHARRLCCVDCARPGDILVLRFTTEPQHLVLVTRTNQHGPHVLHAAGEGSRVIEHHLSQNWLKGKRAKIHGAYRLRAFYNQIDNQEEQNSDAAVDRVDCGCGGRKLHA